MVLPRRAVGLVRSPLQPLSPVPVQPLPLALEIGDSPSTQFQPGRLDGSQDFRGDQRLKGSPGEALAEWLGAFHIATVAQIIEWCSIGVVGDPHLLPAPPAKDQTAQERRAAAATPGVEGRQRLAASRC